MELDALSEEPRPSGDTGMCPAGLYLGLELVKNSARVRMNENSADTGALTNSFLDSGDPVGFGVVVGYKFAPWRNNIVVSPFLSFDVLKQTVNHSFPGTSFLGTTTQWFLTLGVKGGVMVKPNLFLYGLSGVSFVNHDLNINFGGPVTSSNTTTPGFTLGLGGEYKPGGWPASLFLQYQHTWYANANLIMPAASPAFNYAFRREDDTIKLGVNFYFGAPPATAVTPTYPVKALPPK
jgi:hypothetical protein